MDRRQSGLMLMTLVSEYGQCRWSEGSSGATYLDRIGERRAREEAADLYAQIESAHAALIAENARLRDHLMAIASYADAPHVEPEKALTFIRETARAARAKQKEQP